MTAQEVEAIAASVATPSIQEAIDTIQSGYRFTNIYNVRPVTDTLEEIVARMDDEARDRSASISISEDEILLQVQDMERELVGLIDIQAGAVTALVEGGGASGQMSLTLNLPIMIDATKRAQLIAASTEAKVNAVYGLVENTDYYGIKGNASNADVKALWDDAVAADLIASQIELKADQIYLNGEVIVNDENKIKANLIDVENLLATEIAVKDKGVIHSDNYDGTINENGNITEYGSEGWAIDHAGNADFVNLNATGGNFYNVNISGSITNSTITCEKIDSRNFYIQAHGYFIGFIYLRTTVQLSMGFPTTYSELIGIVTTKTDVSGGSGGNQRTECVIITNNHIAQLGIYEIGRDDFTQITTDIDINDYESGSGVTWQKTTRKVQMSGLTLY
jgi:hypothetical protein